MAPLRALYVDLDNTLLGRSGSLFHDGEGGPSLLGPRAVELCHRAGVEVVLMSGRRRSSITEDARLLGCRAYIFESGSCVVDGPDEEWLTEPFMPDEGPTIFEQIERSGAPKLLLDRFDIEYHAPWHTGRDVSHLFRGAIDARDANALLAEHGHEHVRLVDNGGIDRPGLRAYHLVPKGVSKGRAVARHMRVRGYAPESAIAVGDSREDLSAAEAVGTCWLVANALDRDPLLAGDLPRNARVAEEGHGAGVYEAVMTELAERR
ncbi:MAG TPA: HAD hydrolase family protein [Solirubrobacteraceae bacterium]